MRWIAAAYSSWCRMVLGGLDVALNHDRGFTLLLPVQHTDTNIAGLQVQRATTDCLKMSSYLHSTSQSQHMFQSGSIVGSIVDPAYYPAACILRGCSDTSNNSAQCLSLLLPGSL